MVRWRLKAFYASARDPKINGPVQSNLAAANLAVDKAFIFSRWMVSTKGWYKSVISCVI